MAADAQQRLLEVPNPNPNRNPNPNPNPNPDPDPDPNPNPNPNPHPNQVLGSLFLNPTVAAGVAFGSGGAQMRRGPVFNPDPDH